MPISVCWEYFPHNKGLVSGIIVCGFGFGAFFFNFISTYIVNPENLKPVPDHFGHGEYYDERVVVHVPKMIRVLCICWAVLCVISALLIKKKSTN